MDKAYFKDKTVLVTGAGSGIGRELVKELLSLSAKVISVSQTEEKLLSLREDTPKSLRDKLVIITVNLADWKETDLKLADLCKSVDFLVNNAGFGQNSPVDGVQEEDLDKLLNINLKAPINLIKLVAKGMKERKFGAIVNVSSVAGIAALDQHVSYAATKAGLDMVTKVSAKELGPFNIRVNSVNPTVVWTDMGRTHWNDLKKKEGMISKIPMNRFVEIREVTGPIIFLLSERASMINGVTMPIDGGFVAT